ncbi:uncharacterized protein LOC110857253 isoform X2 [Folsomia candida]|uniref:uncharacterized protein LOC110857253 isoform X2 n=1 Tax=Folsomia candida TaxID=158441 RepID=UPI001604B0FE|nr:uncharacterized protein LOC110857253 isoform X2 [Folsomia candida]
MSEQDVEESCNWKEQILVLGYTRILQSVITRGKSSWNILTGQNFFSFLLSLEKEQWDDEELILLKGRNHFKWGASLCFKILLSPSQIWSPYPSPFCFHQHERNIIQTLQNFHEKIKQLESPVVTREQFEVDLKTVSQILETLNISQDRINYITAALNFSPYWENLNSVKILDNIDDEIENLDEQLKKLHLLSPDQMCTLVPRSLARSRSAYAPPRTVGVWVREVMSPQSRQFLASLSAQNGRFDTSNWCIRHAAPCKGGHFLLIGMDEESHSRIQYPAKIYYYTDLLSFTFEPPPYQRGHPDGEAK